jgi:hypothetical protein
VNLEAQWVVGFTDGEGCFHVGIARHPEMTSGFQVLPEFTIVQHKRDIGVLHALKQFFDCGVVRVNHGDRMCWRVRKLEHLCDRIVPFFEKHDLKTRKRQDFLRFRKVVRWMSDGRHLTAEGLKEIMRIAEEMNRGRDDGTNNSKVKSSPS